jgi:predicted nucleic acid-binding protein
MARYIIDTEVLIDHLRLLQPVAEKSPSQAETHAQRLIAELGTNLTVTPVEIEVLVGVRSRHELELTEAFFKPFQVVDKRKILPEDWEEARRLAKHVPKLHQPKRVRPHESKPYVKPRDLGDCLITAIARRLHLEVLSEDKGLKRQEGRTRRRTKSQAKPR